MSDEVTRRLREVGVGLDADLSSLRYGLRRAGANGATGAAPRPAFPLVSCLMLTRGNPAVLAQSLACYHRQTYPNRELVVVTDESEAAPVAALLARSGVAGPVVIGVDPAVTLGDRRNMSVARARGDIIMIWDDDDLSDGNRIAGAVAVLQRSDAAASFLSRCLIWWPRRGLIAVSRMRLWEGTMAVWRDLAPLYPAMRRGEDRRAVNALVTNHVVAQIDAPCHYVYTVTGQNTSPTEHFETMFREAECVLEGEDYRAFTQVLARRLPILEYEALLRRD